MIDLIIRGGTIYDGTGHPAFTGDLGITDGKLTHVSKTRLPDAAKRVINADGLMVTPGFVDMHTHYDAQATWDPLLTPSSLHGCTTVVMGSCGVGFAPVAPDKHKWLIGLMEGVEDIPGAAMHEGIQWSWESFPEYLDALERKQYVMDVGTQIPHGALRAYVMGERGAKNEEATADDIKRMGELVEEALNAGALGFSTSRTMLHKAINGEPVPGTFAAHDELIGLAQAMGRCGHGVFQFATEHLNVPKELPWMEEVAQVTGHPVLFNLSQTDAHPTLWREVSAQLSEIAARGSQVYAQTAGRAIGVLMSWRGTANPFALTPTYLSIMHKPWDEKLAALRSPEIKERLLNEEPLVMGEFETFITQTYSKMFPFEGEVDYEPAPSASLAARAEALGVSPKELAYDALMNDEGEGFLYFPLFNYSDNNLDALYELHQHPRVVLGLSDAGAHCGAICDGGMPTFMLSYWGRDRERGPQLPLEMLIRRQTRDTAALYSLKDRGMLVEGLRADVNLIDFDNLNATRPRMVYDLPAGGRRLLQGAEGYIATLCAGVMTHEQGAHTGELPGRLMRGPQQA
jgi:N-acyl-D-aspartate/D-glutamate deacylase